MRLYVGDLPQAVYLAKRAIEWATPLIADQELLKCCEWLEETHGGAYSRALLSARRSESAQNGKKPQG
jgi:hypothetical protein